MRTPLILSPRFALVALLAAPAAAQDAPPKVSEFGRYEGWSEERFSEWVTTSRYVEMRDGVRLAVDVTRPAVDGVATDERLPVVWTHSRYHRNPGALSRVFGGGGAEIRSMVDAMPPLQRLVKHGYVVAAVGVRGSGASFGRFDGLFAEAETQDAGEIIEWLAAQPWSDGNVGMYGGSYLGITQYMAASLHPPALKAIFPDVAVLDMYDLLYPGGVFREDMIAHWDELTTKLDREWAAPPVDGDEESQLLQAAMAEHEDNWQVLENYASTPFRDRPTEELDWRTHGPTRVLDRVISSEVPAYHFNGWFDVFVLDSCLWFANYEGPQRLTIGAWSHGGMPDQALMAERFRLTAVEQHRWFDRWLKGIENGVEDEPPIRYAVMEDPGKWRWRSSETWPPPGTEPTRLWFEGGYSESVTSVNDGRLVREPPQVPFLADAYEIDPSTTTGASSRWDNAVGAAPVMLYPGLAANDEKALTYTGPVLEEDVLVVGHPVVTLFVTANQRDADLYVVLEEVDEEGAVRYVTEGVVRGSMRALGEAPWDNLGLPFQPCFADGRSPLPHPGEEPATVVMDLHPTANVFDAGHRIRVAVFGADAENTVPPPVEAGAEVHISRGGAYASHIVLPILREE